jgi:hypothetical protein
MTEEESQLSGKHAYAIAKMLYEKALVKKLVSFGKI